MTVGSLEGQEGILAERLNRSQSRLYVYKDSITDIELYTLYRYL